LSLVGVNIFQILAFAEPSNLDRTLFPQWLVLISFFFKRKKKKSFHFLIFFSLKRKNDKSNGTHNTPRQKKNEGRSGN
jgi:hypothetical protein